MAIIGGAICPPQRVVEPPVTIGLIGPRWEDVAAFDVTAHLHHVTLPAPGNDTQLHAYVSEQAGRRPSRPHLLFRVRVGMHGQPEDKQVSS